MTSPPEHRRPGVLHTIGALAAAERRMRWSPEEIERYQLLRVAEVVDRAASVPFYAARHPRGTVVRSRADVARLPVVGRGDLAGVLIDERRSGRVPAGALTKSTSGTTGDFLSVELSPRAAWWQGILALRRNRARGVQPWERTAGVRSAPDPRKRRGLLGVVSERAAAIRAAEDPSVIAAELERLRPVALSGFGHLLLDVGAVMAGRLRPRVVGTGGQVLDDHDRAALADTFGMRPLDLYGAVEVGTIAWQCPAGDLYHVDHDSVLVEVIDEQGRAVPPGEVGEVVVTTLTNLHMPSIRYRLGDRARLADRPCRCGWCGPAMAAIEGRSMDRFRDERGRPVASSRLFLSTHRADIGRMVGRYRVVQDASGSVRVEIVPRQAVPAEVSAHLVAGYQSVLGRSTPVTITVVADIALEPSGKLRQFVSAGRPVSEAV